MYKFLFLALLSGYLLNCNATETPPPAEAPKVQESGAAVLKPGQPPTAQAESEKAAPVEKVAAEPAKSDAPSDDAPAAVKDALQKLLRVDLGKVTIKPSVISGIYEVSLGGEVIYMTADGRYMVIGDVRDAKTGENITEKKRSEVRLASIKTVKEQDSIIFKSKDKETKHVLYVFTDVECPYCAKFHQEVPKLNEAGIEVRYLAFPRSPEGSEDFNKMIAVWCSKDRQKALTDAKTGKEIEKIACDNNPVKQELDLGRNVGVTGTPALILPTGELLPGYVPAERLVAYIEEAVKKGGK